MSEEFKESEKVDGSAHHEHRVKLARKARERKEEIEKPDYVKEEYFVLVNEDDGVRNKRKGPKIIQVVKTKAGTFRSYVGRTKESPEFLEKIKKEGKLRAS